jgi:CRISPR-associated protein Csm4
MLKPESPFVTGTASDTVFGQLCCMLKFLGTDLDTLLKDYDTDPFAVTSCMLPQGVGNSVPKPRKPYNQGRKADKIEAMKKRKDEKEKDKIEIEKVLNDNIWDNIEMTASKTVTDEIVRNSINRISGTTGGDGFSPYSVFETFYDDFAYFHLYVYIKEGFGELVTDGIKLMGRHGFGKDASLGRGRFTIVGEPDKLQIDKPYNAVYTLSNCVLEGIDCEMYYNICTRFGKHGGGEKNPFKNPVVMAKQGALLYLSGLSEPYIGKSVRGVSYNYDKNTVHQGYSLYIPVEVKNDY